MADDRTNRAIAALVGESFTVETEQRANGVTLALKCRCCQGTVWQTGNDYRQFAVRLDYLLTLAGGHVFMCPKAMGVTPQT